MKARLIYNPNSGNTDELTPQELSEALRSAGYPVDYQETCSEGDLDELLKMPQDLYIVAGGDGTLRSTVQRLIGKAARIAVIPMGTANNIGRALNITGDPLDIVSRLTRPVRRPFDVGCIQTPFGSTYFLEACGYGYYASGLAAYRPDEGKSILRSLLAMAETITTFKTEPCRLMLDDRDISGEYMMVSVMNTPAFGPRMKFAPQADTGDGWFDVLRINKENSDSLVQYITSLVNEDFGHLPSVETTRGRKLNLIWPGTFALHADAEVIPAVREPDNPGLFPVSIEILPGAFEIWTPAPPPEEPQATA